jgi:Flp pilus assembly protein TadB
VKKLDWDDEPPREPPKRPYRDTALVYAAFALVIVVVAAITGGSLLRAVVYAFGFWVLATGYGIWRWRARLREHARHEREEAGEG